MIPSLRARLLVACIGIACAAVATTAWLTFWGTTDRLRHDLRRQSQVDAYIHDELVDYARTHATWGRVHEPMAELAVQTRRRIALTTLTGRVLADSAAPRGDGPVVLPERPFAVIDVLDVDAASAGATTAVDGPATGLRPPYHLTPAERAERELIAADAAACLRAAGIGSVRIVDDGAPSLYVPSDQHDSETYQHCVTDRGLTAPSAAELAVRNEESRLAAECLERQGVAFTSRMVDGLVAIDVDLSDGRASAAYQRCTESAYRMANDSLVADPVRLYLGAGSEPGLALQSAGAGRTLVAAGAVALLAVGLSVAVSRRVLRPVAALTAATRSMRAGNLDHHVDDSGHDEIAVLARGFNAMASALGEQEDLRRRLVNDIAHELRTPLANIRGYVEAAQDDVAPLDAALLASLHEEAVQLQRLIDDLQTLALAEAGRLALHPMTVDLADLADQVLTAQRPRATTAGVTLERETADSPVLVHADPGRLRQALANLVDNAVRHTPIDGYVTVAVQADGNDATIQVTDTGEGIAPEHLPHLFDRFWRADDARSRDTGGTGLGLAISHQLVQLHAGTLTATSIPGTGSTFTIRLPLPQPDL